MDTNPNNRLAVGDEVVLLSTARMVKPLAVERVTPTGIAVLSDGSRLSPQPYFGGEDPRWALRGSGSTWRGPDLFARVGSPSAKSAESKARFATLRRSVTRAYDEVTRSGYTHESLGALASACTVLMVAEVDR